MAQPDVRFSLANERTFLAWVRTAIGLVAAGVALFQLLDKSTTASVLAFVLLATGAVASLVGYAHFRQADRAIRDDSALPARSAMMAVITAAVLVAVAVGVVTVVVG